MVDTLENKEKDMKKKIQREPTKYLQYKIDVSDADGAVLYLSV